MRKNSKTGFLMNKYCECAYTPFLWHFLKNNMCKSSNFLQITLFVSYFMLFEPRYDLSVNRH